MAMRPSGTRGPRRTGGWGTGEISRRLIRFSRPGNLRLLAGLLILMMGVIGLLPPAEIRGPGEAVDGDSLIIDGERVRLYAIDAPELDQPCRDGGQCGERARDHLARLIAGQTLSCDTRDTDRYGRHVAQCYIVQERRGAETTRGADIGRAMVRDGHAMAYRAIAPAYTADEPGQFDFDPPWDWRERHNTMNNKERR
jgi:endonuclease YncB( thermonuclease family)